MTSTVHLRTCHLCEAMCGLRISVEGGKVGSIRGDRDDVWSKGYICPKGATIGHLHEDLDRLRQPLIKAPGGGHRDATWDEAFAEVERRLRPVLDTYGPQAVAMYVGNPTAHNISLSNYIGALIGMAQAAGVTQLYSAGTVDQWPNNVVSALLYGGMWTITVPDIDRTDHLLMLGANPSASQGSLLAAPDVMHRLAALQERGGKLVVVDPRRTRTAALADVWIPIRPGTDALLLFAILHTLEREGLVGDATRRAQRVTGLPEALALAAPFSPERVSEACGVSAETIRRMAHDLAAAPTSVVYGRIGTCTQEFGTLTQWLIEVCNIATGNFDRIGGKMFPKPVAWSLINIKPPDQPVDGWSFRRWTSRVRGAPEILGQVPVSCMAEEIATPGDGQLRALITVAGNPVISAPGASELEVALPELDCMISVDNWLNETTRHADVVLPGLSPLEQPHHDDLLWLFAVRSGVRWSDPIFEAPPGRPAEWEILLRLAGTLLGTAANEVNVGELDDAFFAGVVATLVAASNSPLHGRTADDVIAAAAGARRGPERLLDLAIRIGPWGDQYGRVPEGLTLEEVKRHPHGIDKGPLEPDRIPVVVCTPSRTVELIHEHITSDIDRLLQRLDRPCAPLVLTSRRHLRSNNSWMHNVPALVRGRERCTLLVNPADAARYGVRNGDRARVRTTAGEVVVTAEVSDEMMPGVVSLPHGWGHDRPGTRLSVAAAHPGVNSNVLNPGELVDVPSGNAVVNGVPVEVTGLAESERPPG